MVGLVMKKVFCLITIIMLINACTVKYQRTYDTPSKYQDDHHGYYGERK